MVGENIFYKDVFHKIAEELKLKSRVKNALETNVRNCMENHSC